MNERTLAIAHLDDCKMRMSDEKKLVLFDRGYPSFDLIEKLESDSFHYVIRAKKKDRPSMKKGSVMIILPTISGCTDGQVYCIILYNKVFERLSSVETELFIYLNLFLSKLIIESVQAHLIISGGYDEKRLFGNNS